MNYVGGTQSPHLRGFLRATLMRRRVTGAIRYDVHDIDAAGIIASPASVELRHSYRGEGWFPIAFERAPIQGDTRRLIVRNPNPLILGGLNLGLCAMGQLLIEELGAAIDTACQVNETATLPRVRGEILLRTVREYTEANPKATWSDWAITLGRTVLSHHLDGVELGTTSAYWSPDAPAERFSLLDRFLNDPRAMEFYLRARGSADLTGPIESLPFFVVHRRSGSIIRETLTRTPEGCLLGQNENALLLGPCRDAAELFWRLQKTEIEVVAVVPKALPIIVQLRMLGCEFAGKMSYFSQVDKLAELLEVPQEEVILVQFDLARALARSEWRNCIRYMERLYEQKQRVLPYKGERGKALEVLSREPTLIWLWVAGGEEWLDAFLETGRLRTLLPKRR